MASLAPPAATLQGTYVTDDGVRDVVICAADDQTWAVVDLEGPRHGWLAERTPSLAEAHGVLAAYLTDASALGAPLSPVRVTAFDLGVDRIQPSGAFQAVDETATWHIPEAADLVRPPRRRKTNRGRAAGRRAVRAPQVPDAGRKHPRPHQVAALRDIADTFADGHDKAQVLAACGTGKTLLEAWAALAEAPRGIIVVFSPSLALMAQTITEWRANTPTAFELLGVCSDDTVVDPEHEQHGVEDIARVAPVTGDAKTVAQFLSGDSDVPRVAFCTYHSAALIAAAQRHGADELDIMICDEAHRAAGEPDSPFSLVCDPDGIAARRRLFFTATQRPRMADEARFGPVAHRLTFGEAIKQGLLCDYRVVVGTCSREDALKLAGDRRDAVLAGRDTDAGTVATQAALLDAMHRFAAHRALTFHNYIDSSAHFSETLNDIAALRDEPPLETHHVSGLMPVPGRLARLDRLRGAQQERVVVSSARCLGEGVDVPAVDMVAIIDPRDSAVDIAQIIGRALRPSPGKKVATVFVAALVDGDPEDALELEALSHGPFATVARTLEVLAAHDERIVEQLKTRKRDWFSRGERGRRGVDIVGPIDLSDAFVEAFQARLVARIVGSWEQRYDAVMQFAAREGHACVPLGHREGELPLGAWVASQRVLYREGRLDTDRAEALERLPGWTWWVFNRQWEDAFAALEQFAGREGHALVPFGQREGDIGLGAWVAAQRQAFRTGTLEDARRVRLERLDGWHWRPVDARFMRAFEALRAFAAEHGHCELPRDYIRDDIKLAGWLRRQRTVHARGKLSPDRVALLESIDGFVWDPTRQAWDRHFALLEQFVADHGHANVPAKTVIDDVALGIWVSTQRLRNTAGKMAPDRAARLEALPGWAWNARAAAFDRHIAVLEQHVAREGHARVRATHVEAGVKLGSWVERQRARHADGTLEAARVARLEALPGWTWSAASPISR